MRLVVDLEHMLHGKLRVTLRGGKTLVAKHLLNSAQICAFLQEVSAECMSQRVRMHIRRESFRDGNLLDDAANTASGQASASTIDEQRRSILGALTARWRTGR